MSAEKIPLEPVVSSSLAAMGYNDAKEILALQFRNGVIYHYAPVPAELFGDFCRAGSLGQFYAMYIKGKIPGAKMTGHCPKCGIQDWIGDLCPDCGCAEIAEDARKTPAEARS